MDFYNMNSPAFPYTYADTEGDTAIKSGLKKREYAAVQIVASLAREWLSGDYPNLDDIDVLVDTAILITEKLFSKLSKHE